MFLLRVVVLLISIYANVTGRDADSEEQLLTEQPSITQTPEPTESGNDETKITSNIPQVPQNRDYPDYEEEKRQDQKIDEPEVYEPDEFKNVISADTDDLSSLRYSAAVVLAFTLASVVIFYAWRWRSQRTNNQLYEPTGSFNNPISFPGTRYSDDSTEF
ncbi:unnamed protein product [Oikopleura dioica]|uniref:Syndecan/Neurexin domain-containing protein n=1 Tax=Oikopleura dioica TaxID=34765 RepID=E4XHA0_OIKDI|nr:unnamed protein product [Oikopleura dioica]